VQRYILFWDWQTKKEVRGLKSLRFEWFEEFVA